MSRISPAIQHQMDALLLQRMRLWLWLSIVLIPAFSVLDYFCVRPFFQFFLTLRLGTALFLLGVFACMRWSVFQIYVRSLVFLIACLCAVLISTMTVQLGGFSSGYYVGILLVAAGTFSVLPLNFKQTVFTGLCMYFIYFSMNYFSIQSISKRDLYFIVNNSFFFFLFVISLSVQAYDKKRILMRTMSSFLNLKRIKEDLEKDTYNLESLVSKRVSELEDSNFNFFIFIIIFLILLCCLEHRAISR